jgi:hypothetical protein
MAESSSSSYDELEEYQNAEEAYIATMGEVMWVQKASTNRDNNYARTNTWTNYKQMYGWKQPIGSSSTLQYERRNISVTDKIFVARDPEVSEGDRMKDAAGTLYVIRGVVDQAGLNRLWRIDVEEQK